MNVPDVHQVRSAATGRWTDVLISLGIPASSLDGRGHPCPKCGGRDRFAAFSNLALRGAVHCRHCFTSGSMIRPGDGLATVQWWTETSFRESLQIVADIVGVSENQPAHGGFSIAPRNDTRAFDDLAANINPDQIRQHTEFAKSAYQCLNQRSQTVDLRMQIAKRLGVSTRSLNALRVGISGDPDTLTWPMRNATEQVIGVRLRTLAEQNQQAKQWSRRGSRSGLFLPRGDLANQSVDRGVLHVTEGGTDTAIAIDLGLWVIGRASCTSSTLHVRDFATKHQPDRIVVIADNDAPGRRGAMQLAKALTAEQNQHRDVDIIVPPAESMDLRDWVRAGATKQDIVNAPRIKPPARARQTYLNFDSV